MNEHFPLHPRTVVALKALGRLLAADLTQYQQASPEAAATDEQARMEIAVSQMLQLVDELLDGGDRDNDQSLTQVALVGGDTWLDLAERGLIPSTYIDHVATYLGGVVRRIDGPPLWVQSLLSTIAVADDDTRDSMAMSFPEYVGLMRATAVPGGLRRLRTLAEGDL